MNSGAARLPAKRISLTRTVRSQAEGIRKGRAGFDSRPERPATGRLLRKASGRSRLNQPLVMATTYQAACGHVRPGQADSGTSIQYGCSPGATYVTRTIACGSLGSFNWPIQVLSSGSI